MHIPDGYLAPQTTIPVIAGMIPVWGVAAKKVKDKVGEKNLPVLSLGAAFSFTIMMMNVPVAGGSSVHDQLAPVTDGFDSLFLRILLMERPETVPEQHDDCENRPELDDDHEHFLECIRHVEPDELIQEDHMSGGTDRQPFGNSLNDSEQDNLQYL